MSDKPAWQFPPRNGGIEVIQDQSSAHFRDDPLPKLIREAVQNSLDAKDDGLGIPVEVKITETYVDSDIISGSELKNHLLACLNRAKEIKRSDVQATYIRALKALELNEIRCLQIVDSATSGLKGNSWDALVRQEGSVWKSGPAPGGSNGTGKNAVFNVSDLRTVFYSTRCLERGRVEKLQGKANLMSHSNPTQEEESLQHIGFYAMPDGNPILTRDIPDFFRLDEIGTGVFIMGFNPRSSEWAKEITSATIENFFYAIHHKLLVVKIAAQGTDAIVVNHETLDSLFEGHSKDRPSYHYYKAIRDRKAVTVDPTGKIGLLDVYLSIGSGPRRTAYINRNGMLITDSREQKSNPMHPRGSSLWPDFAAVVVPATDAGDKWIRQTENTSHDSMSPRQLPEIKEQKAAERMFKNARDAIKKVIDDAAQVERYGDTSNLHELALLFPDEFAHDAPGNKVLVTRYVPTTPTRLQGNISEAQRAYNTMLQNTAGIQPGGNTGNSEKGEGDNNGEGGDDDNNGGSGGNHSQGDDVTKNSRVKQERPARPPRLKQPRFIPTAPTEATVAFTLTEELPCQVTLALTPAGGEWLGQENRIEVIQATAVSPKDQELRIDEGVVTLTPRSNERVVIKIVTGGALDGLAFRIG